MKDNVLYIFGNGFSRKPVNPSKLNGYIYGCNRFYREYPQADKVFCADLPMMREILQNNYKKVVYRYDAYRKLTEDELKKIKELDWRPFYPEQVVERKKRGSFSSGARALMYAIHVDPSERKKEWDAIYLLGFDFFNMKGRKNKTPANARHVYEGQPLYERPVQKRSGDDFKQQISPFKDKFIRVVNRDVVKVPEWNEITIEEFMCQHQL